MTVDRKIQEVKSATLLRFQEVWKQNFLANQKIIESQPGVLALKQKFKGCPAIVVGAGPSLDKNIRLLRQAVDKSVILASDAALKPLLIHEVVPSFVVCLDPQEDITKFLKGVSHRGITLVAPTIIHPKVLDLWQGNLVFFNKHAPDIPILTEIEQRMARVGSLTPGGSVLSVTYDLAFQIGSNPIIFIGQDLSYPKQNTYSRGSENEEQNLEPTLQKQRDNIVFETDIDGRVLPTLKSMSVTKAWFNWAFTTWKRENPVKIINCSEAGILTDHCEIMPLNEALFRYCTRKINISWALQKALKKKH